MAFNRDHQITLENGHHLELQLEHAQSKDCEQLLGLYLSVYGEDYPLEIGTNKKVMLKAISDSSKFLWAIMRDKQKDLVVGSCIVEIDKNLGIGKITGVAVSGNYRKMGVAENLISYSIQKVLKEEKLVNSLYATTRTVSLASQKMLLQNGLVPLGIFPNARKIKTYETLTLMGIFAEGVLQKRAAIERLPNFMLPLWDTVQNLLIGSSGNYSSQGLPAIEICSEIEKCNTQKELSDGQGLWGQFEFIDAPEFVKKRFYEKFSEDLEAQFYPFHVPNLLVSSKDSDLEIYATFSKKDHYCVLITANKGLKEFADKFKSLIFSMKEIGIYYVETLVRLDYFETICFLHQNKFIPSAIYPAMREDGGKMYDYVLMTRTMVPLDFSEIVVHDSFIPFLKQYTDEWVGMNLAHFQDFQPVNSQIIHEDVK